MTYAIVTAVHVVNHEDNESQINAITPHLVIYANPLPTVAKTPVDCDL